MTSVKDFNNKNWNQWCPACGDFPILLALKQALAQLNKNPKDVVVVSGIGCSGKTPHYINTYGIESIHGRPVAAATGVHLTNPELTVIAVGGDGDGYGIGLNHFVQAVRRNVNITYIVMNNMIYALTKGQTSPTSLKGTKTKSTPHGAVEYPINPLALALGANGTFISRGFSGKLEHLTNLIKMAIQHNGFALVDIFQPCISWNHTQTYDFWMNKTYDIQAENHNTGDVHAAFEKAREWGPRIPIGLFYKEDRKSYSDELPWAKPPVALDKIDNIDIKPLLEKYY